MTPYVAIDGAALAALAVLAFVLRSVEIPPAMRRLLLPCFGSGFLYALGDLGTRAFAHEPAAHGLALLVLYAGYMAIAPSWLLMSLCVAERAGVWPSVARCRWGKAVVIGTASASYAALLTNPWHGAFLSVTKGAAESTPQILWWFHELAACATVTFAVVVLVAIFVKTRDVSRRFAAVLIAVASTAAGVGAIAYLQTHVAGSASYDPMILAMTTGAGLLAFVVAKQRFYLLRSISFAVARAQDPDAVVLIDAVGFLADANDAARAIFSGVLDPPGDVLARIAGALADSDESPCDGSSIAARLSRGIGPPGELFSRLGNPRLSLRVTSSWLRDARKAPVALLLRARDVSAFVAASREKAEHAALLETMWAASGDAVWVMDRERRVRFVNDAMAELLGSTRAKMEGRELTTVLDGAPDALLPRFAETVNTLDSDFAAILTDEMELPSGRILSRTGIPLHLDGELFGRFARVRDITDQRRAEEALRESVKLESLSVLAGGVAHDFNNLLTAILGNAELALREVPASSHAAVLMRDLRAAAERGGELANQLLAYAGRSQRVLETIDLSALVEEISTLIAASVPRRIRIDRTLATDLSGLHGDASQLRQVAMNLVLNAAEAIGEREGRICIETGAGAPLGDLPDDGTWIHLRVTDDGGGMSEETQTRIFDPFFTTKPTGRGLGLASVRGIIAQHRGVITVKSELGNGTTFTVYLPGTGKPVSRTVDAERGEAAARLAGRMLLVDDDPATLRVARLLAESLGFVVSAFERPSDALTSVRSEPGAFRVALIDATMPECSGPELLARVRELEPGLAVVVYSGFSRDSIPLPQNPPTEFLAKPFRRADLEASLLRALRGAE